GDNVKLRLRFHSPALVLYTTLHVSTIWKLSLPCPVVLIVCHYAIYHHPSEQSQLPIAFLCQYIRASVSQYLHVHPES
ncbi:uncharacterized protein LACBIDRAFT_302372, partial [Laccaria bicolor S238N-H82]